MSLHEALFVQFRNVIPIVVGPLASVGNKPRKLEFIFVHMARYCFEVLMITFNNITCQ